MRKKIRFRSQLLEIIKEILRKSIIKGNNMKIIRMLTIINKIYSQNCKILIQIDKMRMKETNILRTCKINRRGV